jgi:myo-inositol-1(or 4)-monophosphatase
MLRRISAALEAACAALEPFPPGEVRATRKHGRGLTTEADAVLDGVLRTALLRDGEGWVSEEDPDDLSRFHARALWVVDALDGTIEFVKGIPEFSISVALLEDGLPVAGGICNPATREVFLGCLDGGVLYNGQPAGPSARATLDGAVVLASRTEVQRGEWDRFKGAPFVVRPTGSVAYKLAMVAAGLADATFTLAPKHIWDVAAGIALVNSAGGVIRTLGGAPFSAAAPSLLLPGLIASAPHIAAELSVLIESHGAHRSEPDTTQLP